MVPALKTLKSVCTHIPTYIDSVLPLFVRCFQKLVKEHLQPQSNNSGSNQGINNNSMADNSSGWWRAIKNVEK